MVYFILFRPNRSTIYYCSGEQIAWKKDEIDKKLEKELQERMYVTYAKGKQSQGMWSVANADNGSILSALK